MKMLSGGSGIVRTGGPKRLIDAASSRFAEFSRRRACQQAVMTSASRVASELLESRLCFSAPSPVVFGNDTPATPIEVPLLTNDDAADVENALTALQAGGHPLAVAVGSVITNPASKQVFDHFKVTYVFCDFPGAVGTAEAGTVADLVRASGMSADAYVGSFNFSPLDADPTRPTPVPQTNTDFNYTPTKQDYLDAHLSMATPALFPGSVDFKNLFNGGTGPNLRTDFFVLPIERLSEVRASLSTVTGLGATFPNGNPKPNLLVPYVTRFNNFGNTSLDSGSGFVQNAATPSNGQLLSRGDFQAQVLHYRLRGASNYSLVASDFTGVIGYSPGQEKSDAALGWTGVTEVNDIFTRANFDFANTGSTITLDDSVGQNATPIEAEQAGVIWSGVYDKSGPTRQLEILLSNLSTADHLVEIASVGGIPVFDSTSPDATGFNDFLVQRGAHRVLQLNYDAGTNRWVTSSDQFVGLDNNRNGIGIGYSVTRAFSLTVTNTNDSGIGSLRQAILDANNIPGKQTIEFDIPGAGLHTIKPVTALPTITEGVVIDGYTQGDATANTLAVGSDAVLRIEIDGSLAPIVNGFLIDGGDTTIRGLAINHFKFCGIIFLDSASNTGNVIEGNFIGTDAAGTGAGFGNGIGVHFQNTSGNTIGGTTPAARNVVSGNLTQGVVIYEGFSNHIQGNYIGTDVTGTATLGNGNSGIEIRGGVNTIGGAAAGAGNLISGNMEDGVLLVGALGNSVIGNYIGTNAAGAILGNERDGVRITSDSDSNFVGGLNAGEGNTIEFNAANGISVFDGNSTFNRFLSNSIYLNGLLGIDLGFDGRTANDSKDPDTGPNDLQNRPSIQTASSTATTTTVGGTFNSTPNSVFTLQFFSSPTPDPTFSGEGRTLLGTIPVITNALGNFTIAVEFPVSLPVGYVVSATATAGDLQFFTNTSEFSDAASVTAAPPSITISDVVVNEGNAGITQAVFTVTRSSSVGTTSIDFTTVDGTAVAQADYLSQAGTVTFSAGEATKQIIVTVNGDKLVEDDETFVVNLSKPINGIITDPQGVGLIKNDDAALPPPPPPTFSINDVTLAEGNGPGATAFTFTITRGGDLTVPASVQYATTDGTATAPGDYAAVALTTVNFVASQATALVTVNVVGDTTVEGNDTFFVNLSNPSAGASITDAQGLGTINNDDVAPPAPSATAVIAADPAAPGKMALIITGTDNGEYIDVDPGSSSSKLKVEVNNVLIGEFLTSAFDRIYVYAKGGDDRVAITTSTTKTAVVFGGEGQDQIKGGNGKDILLGEGGADIIRGRKGRDIIIGGLGADGISGDEDDDLIVAAATSFDADLPGLFAFQKEWVSSNSYSKRRDNARNGTGSNVGGRKLNDASILEDAALDLLSGNSGTDLFFYHKTGSTTQVADKINDKSSSETAVDAS